MGQVTLGGCRVQRAIVLIPPQGPWVADCTLDEAATLTGPVSLVIGSLKLSGTIDSVASGEFVGQRKCRVVAGGNGWGKTIPARHYHDDGASVQRAALVRDVIREAGESAGAISLPGSVGYDYVRVSCRASAALMQLVGSAQWWVEADGKTCVGTRSEDRSLKTGRDYELLQYDSVTHVAELATESPERITIGSVLSDPRMGSPVTVREIEILVDSSQIRFRCRCGEDVANAGVIQGIERIARQALGGKIWGVYRYRVVEMQGDKASMQAVHAADGIPDLVKIEQWPGIPGVHARLTAGSELLIGFIAGDPAQPYISAYCPRGAPGFEPQELVIGEDSSALGVARRGDLVASGGPGTTVTFVGPGAPPNAAVVVGVPYLISFSPIPSPQAPLYGAIMSGSSIVRAK